MPTGPTPLENAVDGTTVHLSPYLNTLIGVMGSGKSAILECIRYALNIPLSPETLDRDYKEELVKHVMGSGGTVTLRAVDSRGQEYNVRRIYGEEPTVLINDEIQPNVSAREAIIRNPLYFGQKDLSANGREFERDLVEKFIWKNLEDVRSRIYSQRNKINRVIEELEKLSRTDETRKQYEVEKGNAEVKLKFYEEHGVEVKLSKHLAFDKDERQCSHLVSLTKKYLDSIGNVLKEFEGTFESEMVYESTVNEQFFNEVAQTLQQNIDSLEGLKELHANVANTLECLKEKEAEFQAKKEGLKEEFAQINRKLLEEFQDSGTAQVSAEEFRKLRRVVDDKKQQLRELDEEASQHQSLNDELQHELSQLEILRQEEFELIQGELGKVNVKHSSLKINVSYKADTNSYFERLKEACKGSRIRETTYASLVDEFSDFGDLYTRLDEAKTVVGNLAPKFEQCIMDELPNLLTWLVPHEFTIEYQGRELRYHSLGQRASALMIFILSQYDNDLIFIDQPEDDLDSNTLYEDVIKLMRKLKPRVQFIFVTHEPNFPVLGDAEQVGSCTYRDGEIDVTSGSIDSQKLQNEVVNIMEGGREAFQQRRKIYELWN